MAPVPQPKGLRYYLGTWSGRILVLNTFVFLALCYQSRSFFVPDSQYLILFGAKDPALLVQGELWRYLTPIFVHIGVIHFAFNSMAMYYVGYQIERVVGAAWFLTIYALSGIAGNVASSVFSVALSAGASSSLFGLLGIGFTLERSMSRRIEEVTGRKPRRSVYTGMVVVNLIFGLVIPGIDNAAHVGGLLAGSLLTLIMMQVRPNRIQPRRLGVGIALSVAFLAIVTYGGYLGSSKTFVLNKIDRAADAAAEGDGNPSLEYMLLSQAVKIDSENTKYRFKRGRLLVLSREEKLGFIDLREAAQDSSLESSFEELIEELETRQMAAQAWQLRRLLEHKTEAGSELGTETGSEVGTGSEPGTK